MTCGMLYELLDRLPDECDDFEVMFTPVDRGWSVYLHDGRLGSDKGFGFYLFNIARVIEKHNDEDELPPLNLQVNGDGKVEIEGGLSSFYPYMQRAIEDEEADEMAHAQPPPHLRVSDIKELISGECEGADGFRADSSMSVKVAHYRPILVSGKIETTIYSVLERSPETNWKRRRVDVFIERQSE